MSSWRGKSLSGRERVNRWRFKEQETHVDRQISLSHVSILNAHTHTSVHFSAAKEPGKAACSLIAALTSEPGRHPHLREGQTHRSYSLTPVQDLGAARHTHTQVDKDILFGSRTAPLISKFFPNVVLRGKENKWEPRCVICES